MDMWHDELSDSEFVDTLDREIRSLSLFAYSTLVQYIALFKH